MKTIRIAGSIHALDAFYHLAADAEYREKCAKIAVQEIDNGYFPRANEELIKLIDWIDQHVADR